MSFVVGYMAPYISDRALTLGAVGVTALGAALCTLAGNAAASVAYFSGGGCLYLVLPAPALFSCWRASCWHVCMGTRLPAPAAAPLSSRGISGLLKAGAFK